MKILYIFPHPDDESFGAAGAMHSQAQAGHELSLLTLTHGEATRVRHELGFNKDEMGKLRAIELTTVGSILGLADQYILGFPDGELPGLDPRILEAAIERTIRAVRPNVVVTYPVHGMSGFPDHLVTHAVVKRVFVELVEEGVPYLKRLAFTALREAAVPDNHQGRFKLSFASDDEVDCIVQLTAENREAFNEALDAYVTYQETIDASGVRQLGNKEVAFSFFQESFQPPLDSITAEIKFSDTVEV